MYAALMMWISRYGDFNEYFMFHVFWRILVEFDGGAGRLWNEACRIDASKAMAFYNGKRLLDVMDDDAFCKKCAASPVHKLTYKYDENEVRLNSNIARLMRGEM